MAQTQSGLIHDPNLVHLITGKHPEDLPVLPSGEYTILMSTGQFSPEIIQLWRAAKIEGGDIQIKWSCTKMKGIAKLFEKFREQYPNAFVPVSNSSNDIINTQTDNLIIHLRCSAHTMGCPSTLKIYTSIQDLHDELEVLVHFVFTKMDCHNHPKMIKFGPNRVRYDQSIRMKPRREQLQNLLENDYNPYQSHRNGLFSHASHRNKYRGHRENVMETIEQLRELSSLQSNATKSGCTMWRGKIHHVVKGPFINAFSMWSEQSIRFMMELGKRSDPPLFLDATESLLQQFGPGKPSQSYFLIGANVAATETFSLVETHADNKEASVWKSPFLGAMNHAYTLNGCKLWAPRAFLTDCCPFFMPVICSQFNECALPAYLLTEMQRMKGVNLDTLPTYRCTLMWCHLHCKRDVKSYFVYPKTAEMKLVEKWKRMKLLGLANWVMESIIHGEEWNQIEDAIQFFNFMTRIRTFSLVTPNAVQQAMWCYPLVVIPTAHREMTFVSDPLIKGWVCEDAVLSATIMIEPEPQNNVQFVMQFVLMGPGTESRVRGRSRISIVDGEFENPLFCPQAATYMNKHKFYYAPLFSKITAGNRRWRTSQPIEGHFCRLKHHPDDPTVFQRGDSAPNYVRARWKYEDSNIKRFLLENQEQYSTQQKALFDATSKRNMDEKSKEIHRKFKDLIIQEFGGRYNRKDILKDYDDFKSSAEDAVDINVNTITAMRNGHQIAVSSQTSLLDWLDYRLWTPPNAAPGARPRLFP